MLKIATFNIENLDDVSDDRNPSLTERAPSLRSMLNRLDADILCLQEVHGQELPGHTTDNPIRDLAALDFILEGTKYAAYDRANTTIAAGVPYDKRNLVILSAHPISMINQYKNEFLDVLQYRKVTADPPYDGATDIKLERPILHVKIDVPNFGELDVINLHLKSRISSNIRGQKVDSFTWRSASAWTEGYFLSSIKRVAQALETRLLIDSLFDNNADANIVVCGDFNAEPGEVPVEAITGRVENTNNPDLRSRVLIPCSNAISESVRYTHFHHGKGNLLDHLVISQTLLTSFDHAEILNENLHDESLPFTFDTKYPESDHAAFLANFRIAEAN